MFGLQPSIIFVLGLKKKIHSIDRNKILIRNKIRNREKNRIRGFDRIIRIRVRKRFKSFVNFFWIL
jgi:hypothetical protein